MLNRFHHFRPMLLFIIIPISFSCVTAQKKDVRAKIKAWDEAGFISKQGDEYYYKGQYDQAISNYTRILETDPSNLPFYVNHASAYHMRGNAYTGKGQYDQAISDHTKALKISPRYFWAYCGRAKAYYNKGQYGQAISDYTKALQIELYAANLAIAYSGRGAAYYAKRQYDQAISDFSKVLEIDPSHAAEAYTNRGIAYYHKREYNKSWEDVRKAQSLGYQINPIFLDELRKASGRQN